MLKMRVYIQAKSNVLNILPIFCEYRLCQFWRVYSIHPFMFIVTETVSMQKANLHNLFQNGHSYAYWLERLDLTLGKNKPRLNARPINVIS